MNGDFPATPVVASVIFLKIRGYAGQPVVAQAALREALDATLNGAVAGMPRDECLILEAADGAALVVLGHAQSALDAAWRALSAAPEKLSLALGLNHGPVKFDRREPGVRRLLGDGIDAAAFAAQAAAEFARPAPLLATRAFRDALAEQSPAVASAFVPAGVHTDDLVRAHELFAHDVARARSRARRRTLLGVSAVACLLVLGVVAREVRLEMAASRRPAIVELDVKPAGEIYVDGELKGSAPALTRLQVTPGRHVLEFRHPRFRARTTEINVAPGEEIRVSHTFAAAASPPPARKPSLVERLKFWK